jgi:VWFA-related protein
MRFAAIAPLLLSVSLLAQTQHEATTVEVVQVPVYVTEAGEPVTGLTRDDFVLTVNGKPQAIEYFDAVDFGTLGHDRARDPRQRRLYVLVFDLLYSKPNAIYRAQRAVEAYLQNGLEGDVFSVASYTARGGVHIILPFTRDREAVRAAVARLSELKTADPLRLASTGPAPGDRFESSQLRHLFLEPLLRLVAQQNDDLAELARRLAPIEGNKHVVLLSGGHADVVSGAASRENGTYVPWYGQHGYNNYGGRGAFMGTMSRLTRPAVNSATSVGTREPEVDRKIRGLQRDFTAAGVFLDTIDINGIPDAWTPKLNDSLYIMAEGTGGMIVDNRNDLTEAMTVLTGRQRVSYLLGFNAPQTGKERNAIGVQLRGHPIADMHFRPAYSTKAPKGDSGDGLRLADILLNDIPQTGLTVSTTVSRSDGHSIVDVAIPSPELLALGGGGKIRGDVLLYVFRGDTAVAFQRKAFDVDSGRAGAALKGEPMRVTQAFDLPPGNYTAKVLVRLNGSDAIGFGKSEFEAN